MAGKVSVNSFILASAKYVDANVKKAAGTGASARALSQAEAKKLPKDLRDNFANFRAKKHPDGTVGVKEFTKSFKAYVAATVKKADGDGDGYLTQAESKKLPKDLRDNFLNFYRATEAKGTTPTDKPGVPVKLTAKLEYVYTNECDNLSVLKVEVKLPNGKKVEVELRNPKWKDWDEHAALADKTFKLEGRVLLNSELKDVYQLQEGTPAEQAEAEKAWNDLYKDITHSLETNMTEGIFVVDKMTPA